MKTNKTLWAASLVSILANTAGAQTANPGSTSSNATAPATNGDQLAEIIVTAQRRSEDVQHAALAIDVVSTQALSLEGATRATDLQALVPALQISESGNGTQSLYLRGVGSQTGNGYQDPAITFNVDGVSIARPSSMTGVFYDLNRVEVLKGPQGTLYGRNATGGAINVVPNLPQIGVDSAEVAVTAGNYGDVHPEVAVNYAATASSAIRAAFTYDSHSGYQTDGTGDADTYAGRLQYLFQFSDDLSVRIAGDYAHDGGRGPSGTLVAIQNPFTGAFTPSPYGRDVGSFDPRYSAVLENQYSFISGRFFEPIPGVPLADDDFRGVLSEITWHNPIGTLTAIPSFRDATLNDFSAPSGYGSYDTEHDRQESLEIRLASENTGLVRWLVGSYYFHESIDAIYQFNFQALGPIQDVNTSTLSKASFARITFAPLDDFRISAGARYTDDRKSFDGVANQFVNVCLVPSPIPACPASPLLPTASNLPAQISQLGLYPYVPNSVYGSTLPGTANTIYSLGIKPIDDVQTYTRVTWHAGLEYDLSENSLLYANWDTGYHAGGFSFAEIKPTYAPETISAYSIGSKNRFLNNTLQLNIEGFFWHYNNQQIPHGGTDLDGSYAFYTDNAGSSTIKGFEVGLQYLVAMHTMLSLDTQYLGAIYNQFTYQVPAGGTNTAPVTSCPFSQTDATHYTVNCAGRTPLQSPKWTGNVGIQQTVEIGDYSMIGTAGARGQSASFFAFELLPSEEQKSYAEGNLSLGFEPTKGPWSVTAFVNNITDRRPYGLGYYNSTMGNIGASVGPPRTEGVRAAYKF